MLFLIKKIVILAGLFFHMPVVSMDLLKEHALGEETLKITLAGRDFVVEVRHALLSKTIASLIKDAGIGFPIPLPSHISLPVWIKILSLGKPAYSIHANDNDAPQARQEIASSLTELSSDALRGFIEAVNYLDIAILLEIALDVVTHESMIKVPVEQILSLPRDIRNDIVKRHVVNQLGPFSCILFPHCKDHTSHNVGCLRIDGNRVPFDTHAENMLRRDASLFKRLSVINAQQAETVWLFLQDVHKKKAEHEKSFQPFFYYCWRHIESIVGEDVSLLQRLVRKIGACVEIPMVNRACAALPAILWGAGHVISHSSMQVIEQTWYMGVPLLTGYVALTYYASKRIRSELALLKVKSTETLRNISLMMTPLRETQLALLVAGILEDPSQREVYESFICMLSEVHLKELSDITRILHLFNKPRNFVCTEGRFIISICTHDPARANDRIKIIVDLLERATPFQDLPQRKAFEKYRSLLNPGILEELSHPMLIEIARYCPHVLQRQSNFLKKASYVLDDDKLPSVYTYYRLLAEAEPRYLVDLEQ